MQINHFTQTTQPNTPIICPNLTGNQIDAIQNRLQELLNGCIHSLQIGYKILFSTLTAEEV